MLIDPQILTPELIPECRVENLPHHDYQPVQKSLLAPAPADPLHPVHDPAKRRFDGVCRLRYPPFPFQPIIEKHQGVGVEVLKICPRHRILSWMKDVDQFPKAPLNLPDQTSHKRFIRRFQPLQVRPFHQEQRILPQKLSQRPLCLACEPILIEKKRKISPAGPDAALMTHPFLKKVLFDARPPIREQNLQSPVAESFLQVLANRTPFPVNLKSHRLKRSASPQRGQRPAHLGFFLGPAARPLAPYFRAVHHQKTEAAPFERRPSGLPQRLDAPVDRACLVRAGEADGPPSCPDGTTDERLVRRPLPTPHPDTVCREQSPTASPEDKRQPPDDGHTSGPADTRRPQKRSGTSWLSAGDHLDMVS
jgi:hypothetical protein